MPRRNPLEIPVIDPGIEVPREVGPRNLSTDTCLDNPITAGSAWQHGAI